MIVKVVIKYIFVFLLALFVSLCIFYNFRDKDILADDLKSVFLAGTTNEIVLYDESFVEVRKLVRGTKVQTKGKTVVNKENEEKYKEINYENAAYYVLENQLVKNKEQVVLENQKYIRTPVTLYKTSDTSEILSYISKGSEIEIIGFNNILSDGSVDKYQVKYNDKIGYVYSKYTVDNKEEAAKNYDEDESYKVHASRTNTLGGGSAANLDYYPYEKPNFSDNIMPKEVRSLYLNAGGLTNVDKYIEIAKESNINAFVVDIKDNTVPAYKSPVMEKYSPTNYKYGIYSLENYQKYIKKLKDAGFYVIGRITTFKDDYYAKDHSEDTIWNTETNTYFTHNGSRWPSAFDRDVWKFNVELAKEAVSLIGFNEIQFDYVRFPDRVGSSLEQVLDYRNIYNEEKAQAIQNFLFYACDQIHEVGGYVSADVFGESAHNYVSGYGQYWAAISNVVDVISGMPYPELFNKYEYGLKSPVWTVPYDLLKVWGTNYVAKQQKLIPTPAIVRTWIQAYDVTWRNPTAIYDAAMVSKQIQGLYDSGLTGGYITWNANSSISKYTSLTESFKKNYLD